MAKGPRVVHPHGWGSQGGVTPMGRGDTLLSPHGQGSQDGATPKLGVPGLCVTQRVAV